MVQVSCSIFPSSKDDSGNNLLSTLLPTKRPTSTTSKRQPTNTAINKQTTNTATKKQPTNTVSGSQSVESEIPACPEEVESRLKKGDYSIFVPGAKLAGCDFSKLNLIEVDLNHADLRYVNFTYTDLRNANLSFSDLEGAIIQYTNLEGATIDSANLDGAFIYISDLENAKVNNLDFKKAYVFFNGHGKGYWLPGSDKIIFGMVVRDVNTGKRLYTVGEYNAGQILDIDQNRKYFAQGSKVPGSVRGITKIIIYDINTGNKLKQIDLPNGYFGCKVIRLSPDGTMIAIGYQDGRIAIFEVESSKMKMELNGHLDSVNSLNWSYDSSKLAAVSDDKTLRIWNVKSGEQINLIRLQKPAYMVGFSPTGEAVYTKIGDSIPFWNSKDGKLITTLNGSFTDLEWSPDGKLIALGNTYSRITIINSDSYEPVSILALPANFKVIGAQSPLTYVSWNNDGTRLAGMDVFTFIFPVK